MARPIHEAPGLTSVTPDVAAARMLEARYGRAGRGGKRTYDLAWFQEDAVHRAGQILERRGGVLIADSVGLGKTYIALALIEERLSTHRAIAVTAPAGLRAMWQRPLLRLARSRAGRDAWIGWVSHALLSRGAVPARWPEALDFIVVDEAHAFRNPRTRRYRELARICRGARVVLLTATPVNNSLFDLYAQLRLFAGDGAYHDLGVPDLQALFRAATRSSDAPPAALHAVLGAVLIRRTRPLVRDLLSASPAQAGGPDLRFPQRAPPVALRYDLGAVYPGIYETLTDTIDTLSFAPWQLQKYAVGARHAGQGPTHTSGSADLMRLMLLKRLESSVAALAASIQAQVRYLEAFLDHLRCGRLLTPGDDRAWRRSDASGTQLLLGAVALPQPPDWLDARGLAADAAADLALLRTLGERLTAARTEDPKLAKLRALLDGPLAGERVLLFSEFRETARWLWRALRDGGGVALVDGGGAFLGRLRASRRQVIDRFAPLSNGAPPPPPGERVRLLIATDVLAEGMNLQDARHVVSFDVPWNPVRLIQRVGRVDRLGSPNRVIQAHAFLPERGLEKLLGLLSRVHKKLRAIHAAAGTEPDDAAFLERIARGDATLLDEIERRDAAPFEAEERLRLAWAAYGRRAVPMRHVIGANTDRALVGWTGPAAEAATVLAVQTGADDVRFVRVDPRGEATVDEPVSFEIVGRALASRAGGGPGELDLGRPGDAPVALRPHELRRFAAAHAAAQRALHAEGGTPQAGPAVLEGGMAGGVSPAPSVSGRVGRATARELLRAVGRVPGGPSRQICDRAEVILGKLRFGIPAGVEHALELILRAEKAGPSPAHPLMASIEAALGSETLPSAAESVGRDRPDGVQTRLIAALVVRGPRDVSQVEPRAPPAPPRG